MKTKKHYDNRSDILKHGSAHFWFEIDGQRFAFCYIRKNACSNFRRMIAEISNVADYKSSGLNEQQFIAEFHRIRRFDDLDSCDINLFVYRDPYERLVSAYLNKFVVRSGHGDMFKSYLKVTGVAPDQSTFRKFIENYCSAPLARDPHVHPQKHHLLPVVYDAALSISNLQNETERLFGPRISERFFSLRVNATSHSQENERLKPLDCVESGELNKRYLTDGSVPPKKAFFQEDLLEIVKVRYKCDYDMIAELECD